MSKLEDIKNQVEAYFNELMNDKKLDQRSIQAARANIMLGLARANDAVNRGKVKI